MNRAASIIVMFLVAACGLSVLICFWPDQKAQQSQAVFSYLQFVAMLILALLTYWYVTATQQYVETTRQQLADQNMPPKISVTRHWYPTTNPFVASFVMEIANPSVRTTSVRIKAVRIRQEPATEFCFEMADRTTIDRVTIPARDLLYVIVKATFQGIPILHIHNPTEKIAVLTFDDVFHGTLEPVIHQL
jgi:hypothetical protein